MKTKEEIKKWERIWGLEIPLGAEQDLVKRIEIISEEDIKI